MNFFAISDDDAEQRYKTFATIDPFPDIPPALLNSNEFRSYVGATGMIFPFSNDEEDKFKTASYEVDLLGKCVYWDDDDKKQVLDLKLGEEFVLRRNSIAFVTLEPMFRLPQYLALRFNLKITHVYRGILLGTGPLVDPGYCNRLSMPLHNLTNNDYVFTGGEGLIWVEFTKLSYIGEAAGLTQDTRNTPTQWQGKVAPFPERKNRLREVEHYIRKAEPHRSVRSSIPVVFRQATDAAKKAQKSVATLKVLGLFALVVTVVLSIVPPITAYVNMSKSLRDADQVVADTRADLDASAQRNSLRDAELKELQKQLSQLRRDLDATKQKSARKALPSSQQQP